jgi:colicin import membrane protein
MKKFHPLALLLKFEGYPPAVVASLFLHAGLLVFLLGRSVDPSDYMKIEDPVIMTASAVDVNPQRLRRLERIEQERRAEQRRQEQAAAREKARKEAAAKEAQVKREQEAADRRRQEELARQRAADEKREKERVAEQTRQREEANRREQERRAQEQAARDAAVRAAEQAQASQIASENLLVAEYSAKIRQIITQSWQIPPSARNGMSATVRLRLVPTGEVVSVTVVQGSGDAVFDRSVIQAVERADRFPELQDLENAVFERNFRTFELLFRPEDLLR